MRVKPGVATALASTPPISSVQETVLAAKVEIRLEKQNL